MPGDMMSMKSCEVEVFSRVTGFFRPVQTWNNGKTAEFGERKKFNTATLIDPQELKCVPKKTDSVKAK
jgi:ribonucleoside-triphosphate reductase